MVFLFITCEFLFFRGVEKRILEDSGIGGVVGGGEGEGEQEVDGVKDVWVCGCVCVLVGREWVRDETS